MTEGKKVNEKFCFLLIFLFSLFGQRTHQLRMVADERRVQTLSLKEMSGKLKEQKEKIRRRSNGKNGFLLCR